LLSRSAEYMSGFQVELAKDFDTNAVANTKTYAPSRGESDLLNYFVSKRTNGGGAFVQDRH
jgi:hypothetical protein